MGLTESKIKDLQDKQFDKLYQKHKEAWKAMVKSAVEFAKKNVSPEPRADDILKVLLPMLEVNQKLRDHQELIFWGLHHRPGTFKVQAIPRIFWGLHNRPGTFKRRKEMSNEKKYEVAKQYVDQQLATMKDYGSAPKQLSEAEYKALVEEVAETVKS